ncbi:hypothetical protein O6H91_08G052100 [Diphasiastrum complanatum]|uniref:Uncharacterized protein n=1 Tax=Diphasiastrum complanatum TaxID=34168 RepID=A0ACC2CXJ7_DIPCM|nr:hypothetical protein O6H91_08G052100 [Diphasiastrum complanatum]
MASAAGLNSAKENKVLRLDCRPAGSDNVGVASQHLKKGPRIRPNLSGSLHTASDEENKLTKNEKMQAVAESVVGILRSRNIAADHFKNVVFQSLLNRNLRNGGSAFASPVWRGKSISNASENSAAASPARTVSAGRDERNKTFPATAPALKKPSRAAGTGRQNDSTQKQSRLLSKTADLPRKPVVAAEEEKQALTLVPPEATTASSSTESSPSSSVESRSGPAPPPEENLPVTSTSSHNSEALKINCKAADMPERMQQHALLCAQQAIDTAQKPQCKRVAWLLKKEFDQAYGPAWHCIVGSSFGSYVTHSSGGFLYFSIGKLSILLFKTTVELIEQ